MPANRPPSRLEKYKMWGWRLPNVLLWKWSSVLFFKSIRLSSINTHIIIFPLLASSFVRCRFFSCLRSYLFSIMSQHASPISAFTELGATFQETIANEKLSMVVGQRHKPAMTKKRTAKQEDSDEDDRYLNEPVAYRPYPVTNTKIKKTKYSTSLDPRGYIPEWVRSLHRHLESPWEQ
ncbi:3983_t:CDS:2 [Cetraspora pellucida]|uniref:3983_t:CDS:1 n=1 Tax=Cetraspora pellucida TaxID=1433469 RepID=A0A9N9BVI3_9GLOM|nr:3983_t:CDS:2 [Cetraspora pellucida]